MDDGMGTTGREFLGVLRRTIVYACVIAAGALLLAWLDYARLARVYPWDVYAFIVAGLFLAGGVFVGTRIAGGRPRPFDGNPQAVASLGISPRELDVLEKIAAGRSTNEIADELSVSPNTVKTHVARLFEKLDAKRRTDAINKARELGILR